MARNAGERINRLILAEEWDKARLLIKKKLAKEPESHWLLTQLAETYYEQRHYKRALALLLRSLDIVGDCPLTLWHLAGTLDALGDPAGALRLYTWLLESKKTADEDPCWQSAAWTDALKTDCVYRMGLCFKHQKRKDQAEYCFRQYIDLLLAGAAGSYPLEEVRHQIRELGRNKREAVEGELQKVVKWALRTSGKAPPASEPPKLDPRTLRRLQEV